MNRRRFLQAGSAFVALPYFETFAAKQEKTTTPPKRMMFLAFGWGVTQQEWYPDQEDIGKDYKLPEMLKPLAKNKQDFTLIQNLWNKHSDGGHWGSTQWLTGANRYAQPGVSFSNSISVDQVAAEQFGMHTRFNSIQLNGSEKNVHASGHGPGLSLAWDKRGKPVGGQNSPFEAYHKLFSKGKTSIDELKKQLADKRSVLDVVLTNAKSLKRELGKVDKAKLEEYFSGIRDIELRLAKEEKWFDVPRPQASVDEPPKEIQGKNEIALMYDIMVAAIQTDSTRVLTYRQPVRTLLTSIGVTVHQHDMSHYHYSNNPKCEASKKRDLAQSELLNGMINKLKSTKDFDGSSLFDNTTVVYGSNLRYGHLLDNCPTIIAGGGSGVRMGEHMVMPKDTSLCNLWLTLLQGSGVKAESFSDSTGTLDEIKA
ncbi:MAG: DUF1552 domain-containing protein [Lentisphaeraceae bacterium]|nr:DUF1552 domain-containing protein [Lentisphaeraceae bacterium]